MHLQIKERTWLWLSLSFVVGLVLFPYGWLADEWSWFDRFMEFLFAEEYMHVMGHFLLFGGLATAVLSLCAPLRQRPFAYLAGMFAIGFIQESLQLITFKRHFFTSNELFDLCVDLLAAGVIFIVWSYLSGAKANILEVD